MYVIQHKTQTTRLRNQRASGPTRSDRVCSVISGSIEGKKPRTTFEIDMHEHYTYPFKLFLHEMLRYRCWPQNFALLSIQTDKRILLERSIWPEMLEEVGEVSENLQCLCSVWMWELVGAKLLNWRNILPYPNKPLMTSHLNCENVLFPCYVVDVTEVENLNLISSN